VRTKRQVLFLSEYLARKREHTMLQEKAFNFFPLVVI
jgi:hypothetical protein